MSEENFKGKTPNICGLCDENPSKYCCPRCEMFYCSLECYKSEKHIECSEDFYRECVNNELTAQYTDEESKKKMIEVLKRMKDSATDDAQIHELLDEMNESDDSLDSDDEEAINLHERLKDLNLDDPDAVWSVLTPDEKNEFEALISRGNVESIIPQWEPWWTFRNDKKLVETVDSEDKNKEVEALKKCPIMKEVAKLTCMTSINPSPVIKFNITNVLASYVFVMRYFNGELEPVEGTVCIFSICANFDTNTNFEDAATAVESVAQKCQQSQLIQTDETSLEIMKHDTFLVLRGPSEDNKLYYCKAALSHLHQILYEARNSSKTTKTEYKIKNEFSKKFPEHKKEHLPNLDLSKVKKCLKKLEYYLSFVDCYSMEYD